VVKTKYGYLFRTKLSHHIEVAKRLDGHLCEGIRLLRLADPGKPLQAQLMWMADLLIETNRVVVLCFKHGYYASALQNVRVALEIAHKMFTLNRRPELVKRKWVPQKEVTKTLKELGLPDWGEVYGRLSEAAHHSRRFLLDIYPGMHRDNEPDQLSEIRLEFYFVWLNHLRMKALGVLYDQLKPHIGKEYETLIRRYNELEMIVGDDLDTSSAKLEGIDHTMEHRE